jgi:hypothetical protein
MWSKDRFSIIRKTMKSILSRGLLTAGNRMNLSCKKTDPGIQVFGARVRSNE